ncbi:mechanosensitive ion channel [Spongiibacter taiwanensis]|uniref:mechanosensitive ion channel family protein n=1 Tax=Spongiibacter taiwanensis TaxID=1748242 RepID=UPI002035FF36|nr:mechanosensitive ion channel domain-containing protein [Spongiibacter taiwanensis]USA42028.1 mechanosensitive ion channel [Spongiibacter taiwanensis]
MENPTFLATADQYFVKFLGLLSEGKIYSELGVITLIYVLAWLLAGRVRQVIPVFRSLSEANHPVRSLIFRCGKLLFPVFAIMLLRLAVEFSEWFTEEGWIMRGALGIALFLVYFSFINIAIRNKIVAGWFRWIGAPLLFLHLIGALDDIVQVLDAIAVQVGNIRISAYGILRLLIFGSLLFWLGRVSSATGQTLIRRQESLDIRTREVLAKLFEIGLTLVVILLLLQVMGINLTALAVFGGALGVGLGFGLQAIASNFISGIIILLDRSVTVGDYVELEDGRTGIVTQLNMRSTTLETYDGKDIVVPNEKFITSSFTNWTHKDIKQRYRVDFSVAYKTNVREMVELVKEAVAEHPQVISGDHVPIEERPDCEIDSFGDNGINMFVEFWMEGIDDGRNRVGGDLLLIILETLQQNGIEIPFPQREVRVLNPETLDARR